MDVPARRTDATATTDSEDLESIVCSHETRPGKVVFTERHNTDGWIATDTAMRLEP